MKAILDKMNDQYIRFRNEDFAQSPPWELTDEKEYIAENKSAVMLYEQLQKGGGAIAISKWIEVLQKTFKTCCF